MLQDNDAPQTEVMEPAPDPIKIAGWLRRLDADILFMLKEWKTPYAISVATGAEQTLIVRRIDVRGWRSLMEEGVRRRAWLRMAQREPGSPQGLQFRGDASVDFHHVAMANVWHLIDLKRAGHSPTRTELPIGREEYAPFRMGYYADTRSTVGSPASSCADIA